MPMPTMNLVAICASVFAAVAACRTPSPASELRAAEAAAAAPTSNTGYAEMVSLGSFDCETEVKIRGKTRAFDCTVVGKKVHALIQTGSFAENSAAQAFLQAAEMEEGPIKEIEEQISLSLAPLPDGVRATARKVLACLGDRMKKSLTAEFSDALDRGFEAYREALGAEAKFDVTAYMRAGIGIELGSVLYLYEHRIKQGGVSDLQAAAADLKTQCGDALNLEDLKSVLGSQIMGFLPLSLGCSGLVVGGDKAQGGRLVHGRNLDGDILERWGKHPTVQLIAEPGFRKFVAVGSAGLFYPGGVSGFNDAGISVSIHQMYATNPKQFIPGKKAALAPWVLQNILRSATSIDDAVKVAQSFEHIASWTILVSSAKDNEAAAIEIAPGKVILTRRGPVVAQANHLFDPQMLGEGFFPYLNKRLESKSRFSVLTGAAGDATAGSVDESWMMRQLSGHLSSDGPRAFGGTVSKVTSLMSTVAMPIAAPGELPRLWFTIGTKYPMPHAPFAGFSVDFAAMSLAPFEVRQTKFANADWEKSLGTFIEAHLANRRGDGKALELIDAAIDQAKQGGVREAAYEYIKARLLQRAGRYAEARDLFLALETDAEVLHLPPYQRVLVRLNAMISGTKAGGAKIDLATRKKWVAEGTVTLNELRELGIATDIDHKINLLKLVKLNIPTDEQGAVDFVILE